MSTYTFTSESVTEGHPDKIADVRGLGLMLGVELAFPGMPVWKKLLDADLDPG